LPIGAATLRYASEKGPASGAKVPLGGLRDLEGPTPNELYVVGEFYVANETWQTEVYALRRGQWVEASSYVSRLHLRGDASVLGYTEGESIHAGAYFDAVAGTDESPSFTPLLEHADKAGAGPDTLDTTFGPMGVQVVDYDVARYGAL